MSAFSITPDPDLWVERVLGNGDQQVVVEVTVHAQTATCPRCGTVSVKNGTHSAAGAASR